MKQDELRNIIEQVLSEMNVGKSDSPGENNEQTKGEAPIIHAPIIEDDVIADITETDIKELYLVENPRHKVEYAELKGYAPSRLGIGKAGPRIKTLPRLQFLADHSAAQDAVFSSVDEEFLERINLFCVQSQCENKDMYLTRPDLGRKLSSAAQKTILEKCEKGVQVQIFVADGLSSAAVAANIPDLLASIQQGLERYDLKCGEPFFVKYGRVGIMDEVSQLLDAEVTGVLIGERPGLITAESMSAYMGYRCSPGMPEARRTVVSNIHRFGTIPVEAGAHIADIIKKILDNKASGIDLKL
jgi:ethanolamine ammonia-lyase small subunit